jgi:hypothetical protein
MIKVLGLKHGIRPMKRIKQRQHLIRGFINIVRQTDYSETFGKFQRTSSIIGFVCEPKFNHVHGTIPFRFFLLLSVYLSRYLQSKKHDNDYLSIATRGCGRAWSVLHRRSEKASCRLAGKESGY